MRRFVSSIFLFLCAVIALADVSGIDNVIYLSPSAAKPNSEATLSFKMKNTVGIRGFQFDLYLPNGVTAVKTGIGKLKASLSSGRRADSDQHTLTVSERPDGAIRFLCGSMDDETFTGSDGEVATLTIAVGDLAVGDKNVILRNIKLTETDISKSYTTDELVSTLTISSQESGDVNDIDNVIYLSPSAANPNSEATLSFKMKNTVGIRGFQFDLYLPNGVTAVKTGTGKLKASLSSGRRPEGDQHTLTVSERPDGAIRFLCGSMEDETFTGSDGEVATLTIVVGNVAEGDKEIALRNIKLTETDISKSYTTNELVSTLTISLQKRGDANGDGTVTVTDIAVVVNHILQLQNTNFSSYGADANGDGSVTVTDIGVIVDMILGNNNANSRELKGLEPQ